MATLIETSFLNVEFANTNCSKRLYFPPKDSNNIRTRFSILNIDKFCCLMTYLANCEAVVFLNKNYNNRILNV